MTNNNGRNILLDIIKAFSIICVVLGHAIQFGSGADYLNNQLFYDNPVFIFIYSFHMPLFMLVSGYSLGFSIRKRALREQIINKSKSLLIPILSWAVISFILSAIQLCSHHEPVSLHILIKLFSFTILTNSWFLWAVFWCSLVVLVVYHLFKDKVYIYIILYLVSFFIPNIIILQNYLFLYPYFIIGYFFNKYRLGIKFSTQFSSKKTWCLCTLLFFILLLFYNYDSYIYTSGYFILNGSALKQLYTDVFRFIIGLVGSAFIILSLEKIINNMTNIPNIILFIGQNTKGIYLFSGIIISYGLRRTTSSLPSINYTYTFLESIIILSLSFIATGLVKKSPLLNRLLLGGK